jgi:hypothetical protein
MARSQRDCSAGLRPRAEAGLLGFIAGADAPTGCQGHGRGKLQKGFQGQGISSVGQHPQDREQLRSMLHLVDHHRALADRILENE